MSLTHRARENSPDSDQLVSFQRHQGERIAVAVASLPLGVIAVVLLVRCAPADSLPMAASGLHGVIAQTPMHTSEGIAVAVILGMIALVSRWSMIGPQVVAWTYIIPAFLLIPVGTSLTGAVVTPGKSMETQILMRPRPWEFTGLVATPPTTHQAPTKSHNPALLGG